MEQPRVKASHLVAAATGALFALKAMQWWRGYSVDATGGLGPFLPPIYLVVAMIPALVAVIAILRAVRQASPKAERLTFLSIALFVLAPQWLLPSVMMPGFKARMSQFSASEFQALADSMRSAAGPAHRGDLLADTAVAKALADAHAILRVAPVHPKGYADSQGAQIRWGGGLAGAFAVDIRDGETEPLVSADAIDPIPLYSNVRLAWIF